MTAVAVAVVVIYCRKRYFPFEQNELASCSTHTYDSTTKSGKHAAAAAAAAEVTQYERQNNEN